MTVTHAEVTFISCIVISLTCALVGYLSPCWLVDKTSTIREIAVGLNYACVREKKNGSWVDTYCKPLPTGAMSDIGQPVISIARWVMTCHLLFMLISCGCSLSFLACTPKTKTVRWAAAMFAFFGTATGMSGLLVVGMNTGSYQHLFQHRFPELNSAATVLVLGWSFYLSCAGFALFSLVFGVEIAVLLREGCKDKWQKRERKLLLKDEIKVVYGSVPFLMDATISGEEKAKTMVWPPVETCEIDMFKTGIVPVHDERRKFPKFIYPWRV